MMRRTVLIAILLSSASCCAGEVTYICPPAISVSWKTCDVPTGWETLSAEGDKRSMRSLAAVAFTDGHPKQLAYLRPVTERSNGGTNQVSTYAFQGVSEEGIWIVCQYHNTAASVFRRLPDHKLCEVAWSKDDGVKSIRCR